MNRLKTVKTQFENTSFNTYKQAKTPNNFIWFQTSFRSSNNVKSIFVVNNLYKSTVSYFFQKGSQNIVNNKQRSHEFSQNSHKQQKSEQPLNLSS